jgi:hypothetical protein
MGSSNGDGEEVKMGTVLRAFQNWHLGRRGGVKLTAEVLNLVLRFLAHVYCEGLLVPGQTPPGRL